MRIIKIAAAAAILAALASPAAFAANPSPALAGGLNQAAASPSSLRHEVQYCARGGCGRRCGARRACAPYWAGPGPSYYYGAYPAGYSGGCGGCGGGCGGGCAPAYPAYQPYPAGVYMQPVAPVVAPLPVYAPAPVVASPCCASAPAYAPVPAYAPAPFAGPGYGPTAVGLAPTPVITTAPAFPFSLF